MSLTNVNAQTVTVTTGGEPPAEAIAPRPITIVHLSDLRFGSEAARHGAPPLEGLPDRLREDLVALGATPAWRPDLLVVSGDLARRGRPKELARALSFLQDLGDALDVPRRQVIVVPGDQDVNLEMCEAHFINSKGLDTRPRRPYREKWEPFKKMFDRLYEDVPDLKFRMVQPWTLFEIEDLHVAVAGLNSTIHESHLDEDHHGFLGREQLAFFAGKLGRRERRPWTRLGVVHHAVLDGRHERESLRDRALLEELLAPHLDLLLTGHAAAAFPGRLPEGPSVLAAGRAIEGSTGRTESSSWYQIVRIEAGEMKHRARRFDRDQARWVDHAPPAVLVASGRSAGLQPQPRQGPVDAGHDAFLERVARVCNVRMPEATVETIRLGDEPAFLSVEVAGPGAVHEYPVGACERGVTREDLERFAGVHERYQGAARRVRSELVYQGELAPDGLVELAHGRDVRLVHFDEYQRLLDLREYGDRLQQQLERDPRYPRSLYVPQRYVLVEEGGDEVRRDILAEMIRWLDEPEGRFILVLGDFGTGKTFLLNQLARHLSKELPNLDPVLVELGPLEKPRDFNELVALHLARAGQKEVDLDAFRYMLGEGRIALLFDGYDELAGRVTYDHAARQLGTLLMAADGHAKIVVTCRTQHFSSDQQAIGAVVEGMREPSNRRIVRLLGFDGDQVRRFLVNHFENDRDRAERRLEQVSDIRDLLGLSRNPRMLGFIAELPEDQLEQVHRREGAFSAATLYRLILERWLEHEVDYERGSLPAGDLPLSVEERWDAARGLAVELWSRNVRWLSRTELEERVARIIEQLPFYDISAAQAAHTVGSGTLLVRDEKGQFGFIHESVMEWLVAEDAARRSSEEGRPIDLLSRPEMSELMASFFCDLAGRERARGWAEAMLGSPAAAGTGKKNARRVLTRLGAPLPDSLLGADLRGQDLSGKDLREYDLRGADLTGSRLVGTDLSAANLEGSRLVRACVDDADLRQADLSRADLTGASLIGADLRGATLTGVTWRRSALVGARLDEGALDGVDAWSVAAPGGEGIVAQFYPAESDAPAVACSAALDLVAIATGSGAQVWDVASGQPLRTLHGHAGWVRAVAFAPDGRLLATASADFTIRLWDPASGQLVRTLWGHAGEVRGVAFSDDGELLASASSDHTVRLWDPIGDRPTRVLEGHENAVRGVAFSALGRLASASSDRTVRIWDPVTGALVSTLGGHGDGVNAVAFSPDGTLLASACSDCTLRLWNPVTGELVHAHSGGRAWHPSQMDGHTDPVRDVAFSRDGGLLASVAADRTVRLWDPVSNARLHVLRDHAHTVIGVAFGERLLVTASHDRTVRLWDPAGAVCVREIRGHTDTSHGVAFSSRGPQVAVASSDGAVRLWDVSTGRLSRLLRGHQDGALAVAYSPDGSVLSSGAGDGRIRLWNPAGGELLRELTGHSDAVTAVAFSGDGRLLASASADRSVVVWEPTTGRRERVLSDYGGGVLGVALSHDGRLVASASEDHSVLLWRSDSGESRVLEGHADSVTAVALGARGRVLASASSDGTVRVWDPASGELVHRLEGHVHEVLAVAVRPPEDHLLASASRDCTIKLWDLHSGQVVHTLVGHVEPVRGVAFSPDGRLLASTSTDRTVRIWNAAEGRLEATLLPLPEGGWACLLPGGAYKLVGSPGGRFWYTARLCRFEPGELDGHVRGMERLQADRVILH